MGLRNDRFCEHNPNKLNIQMLMIYLHVCSSKALLAKAHPYACFRRDAQVLKAISDRLLPSFDFPTSRSKEEKSALENVCNLCWNHEPDRRAGMSFIVTNLKDFQQRSNTPRPRDYESEERNAKRRRVMSVDDDFAGSDTVIATHGIQNINLDASNGPTSSLLSHFAKFNMLIENKNALTEVRRLSFIKNFKH